MQSTSLFAERHLFRTNPGCTTACDYGSMYRGRISRGQLYSSRMILYTIDSKAALSVQTDTVQRTMRHCRISRLTLCSRDNEAKRISCKACGAPRWDWQLHARLLAILQHRDLEKISLQQVSAHPISVHKDFLSKTISRQSALKTS